MTFKSYPNVKTTPNRKARKGERNKVFIYNKTLRGRINRVKRDAKRELNNA